MKLSASKIHRAWQCPASAVLPQNIDDTREERTEPARTRGNAVHRFLERVNLVGRAEALAEAIEDVAAIGHVDHDIIRMLEALDLDNLPTHLSSEVAYAYNLETGVVRELGRNLGHRDYDQLAEPPVWPEIPGTFDVIGFQDMGGVRRGYVGDYKTGWTRYPAPDQYGQTMSGALCVQAAHNCDEVVVELIHLDEDGQHYASRRTMDGWDLEAASIAFSRIPRAIAEAQEEFLAGRPLPTHEGAHCDFCGAYKSCSAKLGLARSMPAELIRFGATPTTGDKGEAVIGLAPGVITRENAGEIFVAAERMQTFLGLVKTEICNMGWTDPVPLPDGRTIQPVRSSRRELDGHKVAAYLERKYGREEALSAVDIKVTMDSLRRVVARHKGAKEKIETKKGDGVLDLAIAELEAAGAVAVNTTETCKPRMPRRGK